MCLLLRFLLTIGFLLSSTLSAHAVFQADEDKLKELFSDLESKNVRVLSPSECEKDKLYASEFTKQNKLLDDGEARKAFKHAENSEEGFLEKLLSWVPTGIDKKPSSKSCSPRALEKIIHANSHDLDQQAQGIRRFFSQCQIDLEKNNGINPISAILKLGHITYNLCRHPYVRKVHINLDGLYILRGFLAVKPGQQARPLVIQKCGVFCNAGDSTTRGTMIQTFDSSPVNTLLVGNFTGSEFLNDNSRLAAGGHEEGMAMIRLARWVERSPLAKYTSSIHGLGLSLGSHANLYAGYYNDFVTSSSPHRNKLFNSITALCPVVNLKPTLTNLFIKEGKGLFTQFVISSLFSAIFDSTPILGDILKTLDELTLNPELPHLFAEEIVNYYDSVGNTWQLPPFENIAINTVEQYWMLNHFQDFSRYVQTPTLAIASTNDDIVPYKINSEILAEKEKDPSSNSKVKVLTLAQGNHCATSQVYGWGAMTSLLSNFILSHSPETMARQRTFLKPLVISRWPSRISWSHLQKGELHTLQRWEASPKEDHIKLHFRVFTLPESSNDSSDDHRRMCQQYKDAGKFYSAPKECNRVFHGEVHYKNLPEEIRRIPRNEVEAHEITRWANTNIQVLGSKKQLLPGTRNPPAYINWKSY